MEDDLSPIESALASKRKQAEKETDRKALSDDLAREVSRGMGSVSRQMIDALHELSRQMHELSAVERDELSALIRSLPDREVKVTSEGIDTVTVNAAEIIGLEKILTKLISQIQKISVPTPIIDTSSISKAVQSAIKDITVNVEVETPNVSVPPVDFSSLLSALNHEKALIIEERYEYNEDGELDSVTETYSDGTSRKAIGISSERVKYEY